MRNLERIAASLLLASLLLVGAASGQSPQVLYTWAGTGNIADWATSGANFASLNNSTAGQLTVVELGDELDPNIMGGPLVIRDGFNRRSEASTAQGGLDVTGLEFLEIDIEHNGSGPVNVQLFLQATPDFNYLWAGNDGSLRGPDWAVNPGLQTLKFPLGLLTPAQQAYIRTIGLSVRDHTAQGNLTWTIYEMRSTGTPLTSRVLANHDVGSSDNGLQGAFTDFEIAAIVGNDGSQNQTGLSHNAASGSLQWTDRGNGANPNQVSGAAVGWGNGTVWNGNSFNERLSDFSNYDTVTFRISATDALNAGGDLGIQGYFQNGSFTFQLAGNSSIPIDGQFHDLTFSLANVADLGNIQWLGINLFSHANDLVINVDSIRFDTVVGVPGDYNADGSVDAADYTVWRDNQGSATPLPNADPSATTPNLVDAEDYDFWRAQFGAGGMLSSAAVPEPAAITLVVLGLVALGARRQR